MQSDLQKRCSQAFGFGLGDFPLYTFQSHQQALDGLRAGLEQGQRLLCLTGPPGSGKSAVFSALYASLTSGYAGLVTQPGLGDVLARLKGRLQLGTDSSEPISERELMAALYKAHKHNLPIIQLVDNADKLGRQDFIQLNQLYQRFGGQLVLSGTPALLSLFQTDEGEDAPDPVQPDQVLQLGPLSKTETGEYIQHRLRQVDFNPDLFSADAVTAVTGYSGGLPQLINMLCFMALAESCVDGEQQITADAINAIAKQRWSSGIYPFHAAPPTPEKDTVGENDGSQPLASDGLFYDDETPQIPPFVAGTTATTATEAATPETGPKVPTRDNPDVPVVTIPTVYSEERQPSPGHKPRKSKRWLVAGFASTAMAGLGLGLAVNTGLFDAGYERLRHKATAKLNQLACVESSDNVLTSTSPPRGIATGLPPTSGSVQVPPPPPPLARQDEATGDHSAPSLSPQSETTRNAAAVTTDADIGLDDPTPALDTATDPVSDFAAFEQQAIVSPPQAEQNMTLLPPARQNDVTDERNAPALSPQSETTRNTAAIPANTGISRDAPIPAPGTTVNPVADVAAFEQQTIVPPPPEKPINIIRPSTSTDADTENNLTAQTQPDAASGQQEPQNSAVGNNAPPVVVPIADQPAPDTTADPVPATVQSLPTAQTEHPPIVQKETSETNQSNPPLTPAQQSHIANLYLKRAEYEMRKGDYADALISIDYGLESMPYHPVLSRMRALVLKEINGPSR